MERIYIVPLRKAYRAAATKRARKAMVHLQEFLKKHMKTSAIVVGQSINEEIWKNSMGNPPRKIKIHVEKDKDGIVRAEMFGVPIVKPSEKKEEAKAEKKEEEEKPKAKKQKKPEPKPTKQSASMKDKTPLMKEI